MGQCYGKTAPTAASDNDIVTISVAGDSNPSQPPPSSSTPSQVRHGSTTPARPSNPSPWASPYPHGVGVSPSPGRSTPRRNFFRRPFPPPSPAKHIKASLAKRFGYMSPKHGTIPEEGREGDGGGGGGAGGAASVEAEVQQLDKTFGYNKNFGAKYELGKEVGRGHFGHTCSAKGRKGDLKDEPLAVKIISKAKVPATSFVIRLHFRMLRAFDTSTCAHFGMPPVPIHGRLNCKVIGTEVDASE